MGVTVRKMPPPPAFLNSPEINRWLIDLQAFILTTGGIDPTQVSGFSTVQNNVAVNSANIVTLNNQVSTLSSTVSGHTTSIASLNSSLTSLSNTVGAISRVRYGSGVPLNSLGGDGDWYADITGFHIYVRVSGAYQSVV